MANQGYTVKFTGQFDTSQITKGLQDIKKQMSNSHIGEDLRKQLETALSKVEANIPALEKMSVKGEYNTKDLEAFQKIILQVSKDMQALDKLAAEADFTKTFSAADTEKIKQFEKQLTEVENKLKNTRKEIIDNFSKSDQGKIGGKSNATLNGFIEQLISVPPDQIESKLDEIIKETEQQANNAVEKLQQDFQTKVGHKTGREGFIELIFGKDSGVSLKDNKTLGFSKVTGDQGAYSVYNKIRDDILALKQDASAEDINKILERYQAFVEEYFNVPEGKQSILANIITPEIVENLKQFTGEEGIAKLKALLGEEKLKLLADGEAEKLKLTQEQAAFLKQRLDELVQSKKLTADQAKIVEEALGGMNNKIQEGSEQIRKEKTQADALSATFGSLANRITNSISALTVFNKSIQIIHKAIDSVKELDAAFTQIAIVSEQSNEQAWQMFDSFNKLAKQYSITTKDLTEGAKLFYQQGLNATDTMKMVEASTISAALGEVTMTEAANTLTAAIQGYNESAAVAMDYTDKIAMVGAVSAADFNELSAAMEKTASSAYTAGIDFDHLLGFLGRMIEVTREAPANLGTAMKTIIARFEDMKKDPNALIDGASANKVESALATIGIALRDTAGEFRPLQDVFVELGKKWDSLTRNQQAYIATVAAGSRQQSRFLAMMNDFDRTLELIEESQNSGGAAAKQYAIYQDSAAAATARLTAAWEEFYTKIVNSEQIIWVLDRLKDLVEVMTKVGPIVSAIGASLAALGGQAIIKGLSGGLAKTFTTVATTGKMATLSIKGMTTGAMALVGSLIKIVAVLGLVVAAVWAGIEAWKAWDKHVNPEKYEIKELTDEIKNLNEIIGKSSEKVKSLEDLMERYDELSRKIYRTKEEQEELNDVINQIGVISKKAAVTIDENGNAHLKNSESVKKEIEAEKELIKSKSDKKYEKTQKLLSKDSLTAEQAREAGLEEYADALEETTNDNIKRYNKLNDIKNKEYERSLFKGGSGQQRLNELKNSDLISKRFEELTSDNEFSEYLWKLGYGNFGEIKSISDLKANAHKFGYSDMDQNYQKAAEKIYDFMIKEFDEDFQEALKIINDSDALEKEKENQRNNALQQYFSELSEYDESASAFFNLMSDGLKFSGDQLDEVKKSYEDYYNDNKEAIDEYLASDRNQQDIDKFMKAIEDATGAVAEGMADYADNLAKQAKEASKNRTNQRRQFWRDNVQFLSADERKAITSSDNFNGFALNDKITSSDLNQLSNIFKLNISKESKLSLFDLIITDENDEFQKLGEKYVNSLANGITKESEEIRGELKNKLLSLGLTEEDIIKYLEDLVPTFRELLEEKIDEDFSNYNTTRKGATDLTKLKSKERKQFLADNENADKYFEYNSDGEESLNVLGKITLLEEQRSKVVREINDEIAANTVEYNNNLKEIKKLEDKGKDITDEEKSTLKVLKEKNEELREANNLYQKQKEYINNSSGLHEYESMALQANVNKAQEVSDNIKTIAEAWAEYQQGTEDSYLKSISTLNQLDASYQSLFMTVSDKGEEVFTLNQDIVNKMIDMQKDEYEAWRTKEVEELEAEKVSIQSRIDQLENYLLAAEQFNEQEAKNKADQAQKGAEEQVKAENAGYEKGKTNADSFYNTLTATAKNYFTKIKTWATNVIANLHAPDKIEINEEDLVEIPSLELDATVKFEDFNFEDFSKENQAMAQKLLEVEQNNLANIEGAIAKLGSLSPEFQKTYDKAMKDAMKGSKGAEKSVKALEKAYKDLMDALEDLDDLIIEVNRDLKDINVDYNPFTDLFEAWEHEWDYYYNIKRLIQQIEDQGKYIDGIISADYTSADQKIAAEQAKVGRLLAAMAANDAYIESLRTGMSQTALELMDEFGEYYKINPDTGQLYQHDTSLNQINNIINQRRQEIYELQKLQNEKENDLSLEQAKLDALEQEKSAYESILSTVESQLDSLKDDEDIIADVSGLEAEKANIKANITITDESIDVVKDVVCNMEDEIQEIEVDITLKEQSLSKLEEYVDKMEDKVSEYEEYWENLNSTIAEQQELLQSITEEYQKYVDTAISTEQDLYNAIVENYQNEINQKKKQYDELKNLDKDYLASVKDSINEERKAREDANKQKSYQQSLQRAQLLQQDTSGAYRAELAQLNKDIEQQRQDLYDDLVDKQVEALEKEIEKRHELYDKEVAVLEERLAYMQENAILLWEMVNNIVAEGSENMMSILENTTAYINSNELAKDKQRKQWEYNVKKTFDGVQNKTIDMLNALVEAGNKYINDKLPEVGTAVDNYTEVYQDAAHVIANYNELLQNNMWSLFGGTGNEGAFQTILNTFMSNWNSATNALTGYTESWQAIIEGLRSATEGNIQSLRDMNNQGGSIKELDKALRDSAKELYEDFLNERRRYRDELDGLVDTIRTEITAAIKAAADAIRGAANSLQVNPNKDNGGTSGSTGNNGSNSTTSSGGGGGTAGYKGWTAWFRIANYYGDGKDYVYQDRANFSNATYETLYNSWNKQLESMRKKYPGSTSWQFTPFATGGFADFTGPAWLDGTKSQPEAVLNPKQTRLFTSMVSSLERTANNSNINSPLGSSYNIGDINTTIQVDKLDNQTDINRLARQVEDKIVKDIRNRIPVSVTKGV